MSVRFQIFLCFGVCLSLIVATLIGRDTTVDTYADVPFLQTSTDWADSMLQTMDLDEKVGQLLLVDYPSSESSALDSVIQQPVNKGHIGGLIFRNHSLSAQVSTAHAYQRISKLPLWIATKQDTLSDTYHQVPDDLSFIAIEADSLVRDLGEAIGSQSRDLGIHLQFTPTLTRNYSHQNRSHTVSKLLRVHQGIQRYQIFSCSRYVNLREIQQADSTLHDSLLYPYKEMVRAGVSGMFVDPHTAFGYSQLPALSIDAFLRNKLEFNGLIFAEIPDSSTQVSSYVREAIGRGVDVLVVKDHIPLVSSTLREMVRNRDLSWEDLDRKVRKVLMAKAWSQSPRHHRFAKLRELPPAPSNARSLANRNLVRDAITLVKNEKGFIPILPPRQKNPLLLTVGSPLPDFAEYANLYTGLERQQITREPYRPLAKLPVRKLSRYSPVIVALHDMRIDVVADADFMESLRTLSKRTEVIVVHFGDPQWLAPVAAFSSILQVYNNAPISQQLAAQALFGGESIKGKLPVNVSQILPQGSGQYTDRGRLNYTYPEAAGMDTDSLLEIDRIVQEGIAAHAMPGCQVMVVKSGQVVYHKAFGHHTYDEYLPVRKSDLYDLASLTKVAATTVAAMRMHDEGRLDTEAPLARYFQNRGVYFHTRTLTDTTQSDTLAPTEIMSDSSGLAFNRRPAGGYIHRTANFSTTEDGKEEEPDTVMVEETAPPAPLPIARRKITKSVWVDEAPVFEVNLTDLLIHRSGLQAAMPILPYIEYRDSLTGRFDKYFQETPDSLFSIEVADNFFLRNDYRDSIWESTKRLRVYRPDYEYSDVNMVLVQQVIDSINQMSMDHYLDSVIYHPLGLATTRYNPAHNLPKDRLVPTEVDRRWRGQLLHGYVHDPTAALLGGVSGNAGLFSNANDLAVLFQMILNGGKYAGQRFLSAETIRKFTAATDGHRGLGFDKPPRSGGYIIGDKAPRSSFGHTGFTGTCVWVDPENELIYVFLSNRVYPSAKNWRINTLRIRQRVHDAIYSSLFPAANGWQM